MWTSHPWRGRARASERATWAEPPRGKNMRALRTRRWDTPPMLSPSRERECGRDPPAAGEHDAVAFPWDVHEVAAADQRGGAAAVEVERVDGAEVGQRLGQLRQREAGLV